MRDIRKMQKQEKGIDDVQHYLDTFPINYGILASSEDQSCVDNYNFILTRRGLSAYNHTRNIEKIVSV